MRFFCTFLEQVESRCRTCVFLRYMDELMRLKAAAREAGCDYLTWNDIQACIDQVNLTVQEEHERKRQSCTLTPKTTNSSTF